MAILQVYADSIGSGTCRSCSAPIVWVEQTNGKKHPIDGAVADLTPVKTVGAWEDPRGREVWHIDTSINLSHFATCPDGRTWRKK